MTFDRLVAAGGLIVLLPLFAIIACCILLEDGAPIFYRQHRVGRGGRRFWLYKFRSMRIGQSGPAVTAAGDTRVSRVGKVLRRYKLDELPQLWNVLVGSMRLVGPRPEMPRFVDLDDATWREVLSVQPGITDLATLVYRHEETLLANHVEPEKYYVETILPAKLDLNLRYLQRRTFWSDIVLISLTTWSAIRPTSMSYALMPPRRAQPAGK